jgi:hypothetical protein
MATTETVSSNYAGEAASQFFSGVLLSPTSIANGGVSPLGGIRYKQNLPKVDLSGIIADSTCDFTPVGTITRSERVLTVEEFEVNLELCKSTYRPTFDNMAATAHASLAPTFADHLVQLVGANVAQSRENTIWQGAAATAGEFDGFEALFTSEAAQPAAYEVAGIALSAANIIAELGKVRDAATAALYSKEGFSIRISTAAKRFYISAMAALGYMDKFHDGQAPLNFEGIPLLECAGLSDDVMFATYAGNLWYGFGEAGDAQRVDVIDQAPLDGSNNVNVVMKWADGVQVANPQDVITYGITNAGN